METIEKETEKKCHICENYRFGVTWKGDQLLTQSGNTVKFRISEELKHSCGPILMHHLCINKWNDYWGKGVFTYTENPVCPQCLATKKGWWNWFLLGLGLWIVLGFYAIGVTMCVYKCRNPFSQFELRWVFDVWVNAVQCECVWLPEGLGILKDRAVLELRTFFDEKIQVE